jgi:predicted Zn finger-like uncharacterized protein
MIIQCPECKSRYRTRVLPANQSPLQIKCPQCSHQFLVSSETPLPDSPLAADDKPNILLVDDARFFRELLNDLLKDYSANLLTADNAEDTWVMLHQQRVDLLIVDINLPDRNGLDLIKDIRADADLKTLKILAISGVYRKDDDSLAAIRAGADDFISKSFKPHELTEHIEKLLNK